MDNDTDHALLARYRNGDRDAFAELVVRYQRPIYNAAFWVLRSVDDANDIAQEVFLKVAERLDEYDPQYKFFSWIYRIAINESIDLLRRNRREEPLDIGLIDEASMLDARLHGDLRHLFATLVLFGDPAQLAPVGGTGGMAIAFLVALSATQWVGFDQWRPVAVLQAMSPYLLALAVPLGIVIATDQRAAFVSSLEVDTLSAFGRGVVVGVGGRQRDLLRVTRRGSGEMVPRAAVTGPGSRRGTTSTAIRMMRTSKIGRASCRERVSSPV